MSNGKNEAEPSGASAGSVDERKEFEAFVEYWTGRGMEYHTAAGTTGLAFAWECWRKATSRNRWIQSSARMPDDGVVVMAWDGRRVGYAYCREGLWIDTLYGWAIPDGPSHWMPLPTPPTDGK